MDYEVRVDVDAPRERVWEVLAAVTEWPEWTASMQQLTPLDDGPLGVGSRVRVRQPSLPTVVWTISTWEPGRRFTWESSSPGVATAADHELDDRGDGTTVVLRIRQKGLLAPLVHLLIGKRTRRYVQMEADGLKARAEAGDP
ncbi:MAG TPA: SRPBCC family protein [Acidimicrobiales bacterium]